MGRQIECVAVIGAGTMGAAIAALCASAGVPVYLLDIPPTTLTPEEAARGLALEHPEVRNRVVRAGFERMRAARPANLASEQAADLITLGNTADNLGWLRNVDWIVEAIVEQLEPKRRLMAQIERWRAPHAIVSTNTSGLPIHEIAEGCSPDFRRYFLGTHFFNPPRYMKLLELIPTPDTGAEVVELFAHWAGVTLGKGIVVCKDTPNFIANRLGSFAAMDNLRSILRHGFTVEEVDALTGPLIGRPKTATFRLRDLAGVDISATVARNLGPAVPQDESRDVFQVPPLLDAMIAQGKLGNKAGQGFYKPVREGNTTSYWVLDFATLEYRPPRSVDIPLIAEASQYQALPERLTFLMRYADEHPGDRHARLLASLLLPPMAYAARRVPEISDRISSLDRAMEWGYGHELGPFASWDAMGVVETVRRMRERDIQVAPWVEEMLSSGNPSFYVEREGDRYEWSPTEGSYVPLPNDLSGSSRI